jgi:hypothetical protein
MVIGSTHRLTPCFSHTRYGAVFVSTSTALTHTKRLFALFTHALYKCFLFARFYLLRAYFGTGVCISSHMRVRAGKLTSTSTAYKFNTSSSLYFSLEFSHG